MPQLTKGGKWVFGWVVVGNGGKIQIPPAARAEHGFQRGEMVVLTRGSRRSGGFGMSRPERLAQSQISLQPRFWAHAWMGPTGQVVLPPDLGVQPGERLLAVRGSGLALGFLQRGPIYEEALQHPELGTFVI